MKTYPKHNIFMLFSPHLAFLVQNLKLWQPFCPCVFPLVDDGLSACVEFFSYSRFDGRECIENKFLSLSKFCGCFYSIHLQQNLCTWCFPSSLLTIRQTTNMLFNRKKERDAPEECTSVQLPLHTNIFLTLLSRLYVYGSALLILYNFIDY